jgi:hypothetical protein
MQSYTSNIYKFAHATLYCTDFTMWRGNEWVEAGDSKDLQESLAFLAARF